MKMPATANGKKPSNDVEQYELWHLENSKGLTHLNVLSAENLLKEKGKANPASVKVAIIDRGIDHTHPNLKDAVIWSDKNFEADAKLKKKSPSGLGNDPDVLTFNPRDSHGTALAGIVGGKPVNGDEDWITEDHNITKEHQAFRGVAPGVKMISVRLFVNFDCESMKKALDEANNADIILIARTFPTGELRAPSLPGTGRSTKSSDGAPDSPTETPEQQIRRKLCALAASKPVICAAGNGGEHRLAFPACLPNTIAVGACNEFGYRSTYSQHGPGLDVVAPSSDIELRTRNDDRARIKGQNKRKRGKENKPEQKNVDRLGQLGIVTTDNTGLYGYIPGKSDDESLNPDFIGATGDRRYGGTSAAAAQIAGVVALMLQANDGLKGKPEEIRKLLKGTASHRNLYKEGSEAWETVFGAGLVDAEKAVQAAIDWIA